MKFRIISLAVLLLVTAISYAQTQSDLNKTDQQGRKQGHWIKKYPSGNILYEGTFNNDKPVGEFKRYNSNNTLKSILVYSTDSREADATIFHPNGFISSKGRYIDQLKEGKWRFYSSNISGYLLNEEIYSKNKRNGLSLRYYPDSTLAEKVNYVKGVREGEWLQYHQNGKLLLKSFYLHGELNGKFESWYSNGKPEYTGTYKKNMRDGKWQVFTDKGILKYEINYVDGVTKDRQIEDDVARFFNKIEKSSGNIPDPEKSR